MRLDNTPLASKIAYLKRILFRVSIILLLGFTVACGSTEVATVPNEDEAIEILTILYDNGIEGAKQEAGDETGKQWKISVGSSEVASAHRVLHDHGLPRPADQGREGAAKEDGLLKSVSAEKARRLKEIETEIERQLRMLPSVIRVKANVALADEDVLELKPAEATASVVLVSKEKEPTFTEEHAQRLVAGSVPKLKPENVRVIIAYEPPRALITRSIDVSRRNRFVTGIVVIGVLSIALVGLLVHARRKNNLTPGDASPSGQPVEE